MARNDGIDRTVARNQDLETPDDVAKVQEHKSFVKYVTCIFYSVAYFFTLLVMSFDKQKLILM